MRLLGGEQDDATYDWLLTALGNAASDVVDLNASTTRKLLGGLEEVIPCVQAHLRSPHPLTRLYAAAAMQNLCMNGGLAAAAVRGGAHRVLESLCAGQEAEPTKHFAAGALVNIEAIMLRAAPDSPAPWSERGQEMGSAAHAAMEWRKERENRKPRRKGAAPNKGGDAPAATAGPSSASSTPAVPPPPISPPDDETAGGNDELHQILTVQPPTEAALQTRIPLDVAKARSHAQRRGELSSARSDHSDSSTSSSWLSFFTARSSSSSGTATSASAQGTPMGTPRSELGGFVEAV